MMAHVCSGSQRNRTMDASMGVAELDLNALKDFAGHTDKGRSCVLQRSSAHRVAYT